MQVLKIFQIFFAANQTMKSDCITRLDWMYVLPDNNRKESAKRLQGATGYQSTPSHAGIKKQNHIVKYQNIPPSQDHLMS